MESVCEDCNAKFVLPGQTPPAVSAGRCPECGGSSYRRQPSGVKSEMAERNLPSDESRTREDEGGSPLTMGIMSANRPCRDCYGKEPDDWCPHCRNTEHDMDGNPLTEGNIGTWQNRDVRDESFASVHSRLANGYLFEDDPQFQQFYRDYLATNIHTYIPPGPLMAFFQPSVEKRPLEEEYELWKQNPEGYVQERKAIIEQELVNAAQRQQEFIPGQQQQQDAGKDVANQLGRQPGQKGRGVLLNSSSGPVLHTWPVEITPDDPFGGAMHSDYVKGIGAEHLASFEIEPSGEIVGFTSLVGDDDQLLNTAMQLDPNLKSTGETEWGDDFSLVAHSLEVERMEPYKPIYAAEEDFETETVIPPGPTSIEVVPQPQIGIHNGVIVVLRELGVLVDGKSLEEHPLLQNLPWYDPVVLSHSDPDALEIAKRAVETGAPEAAMWAAHEGEIALEPGVGLSELGHKAIGAANAFVEDPATGQLVPYRYQHEQLRPQLQDVEKVRVAVEHPSLIPAIQQAVQGQREGMIDYMTRRKNWREGSTKTALIPAAIGIGAGIGGLTSLIGGGDVGDVATGAGVGGLTGGVGGTLLRGLGAAKGLMGKYPAVTNALAMTQAGDIAKDVTGLGGASMPPGGPGAGGGQMVYGPGNLDQYAHVATVFDYDASDTPIIDIMENPQLLESLSQAERDVYEEVVEMWNAGEVQDDFLYQSPAEVLQGSTDVIAEDFASQLGELPEAEHPLGPHTGAEFEHPSSVPEIGVREDDPEKVDPHEFDDNERGQLPNLYDVVSDDIGAALTPAAKYLNETNAPKVLYYIVSGEDHSNDEEIQELIENVTKEIPNIFDDDYEFGQQLDEMLEPLLQELEDALKQADNNREAATLDSGQGLGVPNPGHVPQTPNPSQMAPGNDRTCPQCGQTIPANESSCPYCQGNIYNVTQPTPPMQPLAASEHQGPHTSEQFAAVAELLQEQGREDEIPTMLRNPEQYAEEMSEAQGRMQPPYEEIDQQEPEQAQEEAPPADTMPVPNMSMPGGGAGMRPGGPSSMMAAIKTANPDFDLGPYMGAEEEIEPIGEPNVSGSPAAEQKAQRDVAKEQDTSRFWVDEEGEPLQVGSEYEMHSRQYSVPDIIRLVEVKPSAIEYVITGEFGLEHRTEITRREAEMEELSFTPTFEEPDVPPEEEHMDDFERTAPGETSDLSAPHMHGVRAALEPPKPNFGLQNDYGESASSSNLDGLVQTVKDYALQNYENGGWDVVIESYDDNEIAEVILEANAQTPEEAVTAFADFVGIYADRQADAAIEGEELRQESPRHETDIRSPWFQGSTNTPDAIPTEWSKTAGANFTSMEQREFIEEQGRARNLDKLDLSRTHYEEPEGDDLLFW